MSKSAAALIFKNLLGMGFSWAAPDWCVSGRKINQLALLFTFCGARRHLHRYPSPTIPTESALLITSCTATTEIVFLDLEHLIVESMLVCAGVILKAL
jgi:hypothetical protein